MIEINKPLYDDNASYICNSGTSRDDFVKGKADMYPWQCVGLNAQMSNALVVTLYVQLDKRYNLAELRSINALGERSYEYGHSLPIMSGYNQDSEYVYHVAFDSVEIRERVRLHLRSKEIHAHTHYAPLYSCTSTDDAQQVAQGIFEVL